MTSYGQFCPVAKTCELFAERWTPLILRELCCGPAQFNDLRRRLPLMSKTLLAQRLRDLERHGVVGTAEKASGPGRVYALTQAGEGFRPIIEALSLWGQRHTRNILAPEDFDPVFLLMSVRSQIPRPACPAGRFVICFEFRGVPATPWGLAECGSNSSVRQSNPTKKLTRPARGGGGRDAVGTHLQGVRV